MRRAIPLPILLSVVPAVRAARDKALACERECQSRQPIVIMPLTPEGELADSKPSPAWPGGFPMHALGSAEVPSFIRERAAHRMIDTAIRH